MQCFDGITWGRCKFQALLFSIMEIKSFDELFEKTRYGGCWFWQM